jgi:hypothetical protein
MFKHINGCSFDLSWVVATHGFCTSLYIPNIYLNNKEISGSTVWSVLFRHPWPVGFVRRPVSCCVCNCHAKSYASRTAQSKHMRNLRVNKEKRRTQAPRLLLGIDKETNTLTTPSHIDWARCPLQELPKSFVGASRLASMASKLCPEVGDDTR